VALVIDGAGRAGTERHVLGLLRGLRARNVPVLLVTSHPGPLATDAAAIGAEWRLCPRPDAGSYLSGLVRILRRARPAVVHVHSGRVACLAARLAGAPAIVDTRHGIPERLRPLYARHPGLRRWEGVKSRLADLTLCVCEADAAWMEHEARLPRHRLRVVPNGIAAPPGAGTPGRREAARAALGIVPHEPLVVFVGRLAPQKAPGRVLEVLKDLRDGWNAASVNGDGTPGDLVPGDGIPAGVPPPRAVICGSGPLEPGLRLAEVGMGLSGAITWTGEIEDAGSVVAAADLMLLPSEWEGSPYVVLEALAEGVPVLATPVGGVPELLAGPLAAGCVPWSPGAWGAAARRFLVDADVRGRWGTAARRSVAGEETTLAGVFAAYGELGWPA
jgi:glycosyltransferase involved in cell wall biosynthesis